MFSDRFEELCATKGVKPGRACTEMGVSRSLAAKWKATKTEKPSADVLEKMSAYFRMSIDDILNAPTEKAPALTKRDERDIAEFMEALEGGDTLMYYGEPLSEEAKESIKAAMRLGIGAAKLEAKRRFTPKKYRKE